MIIGTPEYDHSIPAVIGASLGSHTGLSVLNKPVTGPYGTLGSSRAQLRQILNAPEIKANVLQTILAHSLQAFDQNGDLVD